MKWKSGEGHQQLKKILQTSFMHAPPAEPTWLNSVCVIISCCAIVSEEQENLWWNLFWNLVFCFGDMITLAAGSRGLQDWSSYTLWSFLWNSGNNFRYKLSFVSRDKPKLKKHQNATSKTGAWHFTSWVAKMLFSGFSSWLSISTQNWVKGQILPPCLQDTKRWLTPPI